MNGFLLLTSQRPRDQSITHCEALCSPLHFATCGSNVFFCSTLSIHDEQVVKVWWHPPTAQQFNTAELQAVHAMHFMCVHITYQSKHLCTRKICVICLCLYAYIYIYIYICMLYIHTKIHKSRIGGRVRQQSNITRCIYYMNYCT